MNNLARKPILHTTGIKLTVQCYNYAAHMWTKSWIHVPTNVAMANVHVPVRQCFLLACLHSLDCIKNAGNTNKYESAISPEV